MAKIALSDSTFAVCPEGTHIFRIEAVSYKEDFGKLEITMKTKEGYTHIERFNFVKSNGEPNEIAIGIFSLFAKICLQNFDLEEIDHEDLVGCFIKCEVTHDVQPNKNDPNKNITFSRLGSKAQADEYEDGETATAPAPATPKKAAPVTPAKATPATTPKTAAAPGKKVDLASILGRK
ncbi:hypothetical protein [Anaerocaecibacter muris]|uniref:hypothetical protein n=1 Tax=Anaerocaecibacter muris TaxID=2941513 RepID=UPI00203CA669|nr:hypothetical protein [Anaerocaecibacter muris]